MNRRGLLFALSLAMAGLWIPATRTAATPPKEATVTLQISGMTWGSCVTAVQSALESVKGVKEAKVSLDTNEAIVKYDPETAKVEDLIKAVKNARGMGTYSAKVKEKKK